jgi:hypothetical protein
MSTMEPDEGERQVDDEASAQGTERGAWERAAAGDDAGEEDDKKGTERGAWE